MNHRGLRALLSFGLALLVFLPAAVASDAPEVQTKRIVIRDGKVVEGERTPLLLERMDASPRGYLGVHLQELTPQLREYFRVPGDSGVLVAGVPADSPAGKGGIQAGDVIVSIDGEPVRSTRRIGELIRERKKGDSVRIEVIRNGAPRAMFATLDERKRDEIRVRVARVGQGAERLDAEVIELAPTQALDHLRTYLASPEWRERIEQFQDCDTLQSRIQELEKRLQELEKRLTR